MPLIRKPGTTSKTENRMMRFSKDWRRGLRRFSLVELLAPRLEPILFHAPVQGAAAQAESFGRLAYIALKALQRFANQNSLNRLQAQFLEVLRCSTLGGQSKIGGLGTCSLRHIRTARSRVCSSSRTLPGPGVMQQRLQCGGINAVKLPPIT